jgi:hypothetical protein
MYFRMKRRMKRITKTNLMIISAPEERQKLDGGASNYQPA